MSFEVIGHEALLCVVFSVGGAFAASPVPRGDTLASIARLPDWSGSWRATTFKTQQKNGRGGPFEVDAPLNDKAAAQLAMLRRLSDEGGDVPTKFYHCVPHGLPGGMDGPSLLMEILFTPGRVTMISEEGWFRRFIQTVASTTIIHFISGGFDRSLGGRRCACD